MQKQFPEFYSPKPEDFKKLWNEAIFVLDTNVLLSLYRFPPKTQAKLFATLRKLKKRLWIPHQVALEFNRRRLSVICTQEKTYNEMLDVLQKFEEQYVKHPFLHNKQITKAIEKNCKAIRSEIERLNSSRPKWLEVDSVLENITNLFEGKIGPEYNDQRLIEIYKDGEERFAKEIPPGYKDAKKDESDKTKTRKFGDLLIWYQIIDKATELVKPVIFITEEQKEDWWWKEEGGRNIGARHELKKEMLSKAKVSFHMYQTDQFVEHAQEHLNAKISSEVLSEIKKVRQEIALKDEDGWQTAEASDLSRFFVDSFDPSFFESSAASETPNKKTGGKDSLLGDETDDGKLIV